MADKKKSEEFPGRVLFTEGEQHVRAEEDKPSKKEMDDILGDLYPEKGEKQEPYKGFDISGNKVSEDPERFERTRQAGSDRVGSGFGKDEFKEPKETGEYRDVPYEGIPEKPETVKQAAEREETRFKREQEWAVAKKLPWESTSDADKRREKEGLSKITKYGDETAIDATFRSIKSTSLNPVDFITGAKGYASEAKLKLDASRYGITPAEFERLKAGGSSLITITGVKGGKTQREVVGLHGVYLAIQEGKKNELAIKAAEASIKKSAAETSNIQSSTASRYAAIDASAPAATIPKGGRKLVQFGWKEGSFGQEPTYINPEGLHGQMRTGGKYGGFVPRQGSGVASSLANSKLEISRMKQRVLSGAGGGSINAVQAMQPNSRGYGAPSVINKLAGSHSNSVSKLAPFGQPKLGPSILDKLSANKRRPWR
jgi:hypothetical protein